MRGRISFLQCSSQWRVCSNLNSSILSAFGVIYRGHSCVRAMNSDMGPSNSSGPDIVMAWVAVKPLTSVRSSPSPLQIFCLQDVNHSVSLSPIAHHTFAHHISTCLPGTVRPRWVSVFSLEPITAAWRGVRGVAGLELETKGCILVLSYLPQPHLMMQLSCSVDFLNKAESRC